MTATAGAPPRILVICGPTASGKTGAAIRLARELNGEIISADSLQIYRHMDIGTAKPTAEERAAAVHHLVDCVDPAEPYDAARYAAEAGEIARRLVERGKTPIVTGGTGLYIRALIHGVFEERGRFRNERIRRELKQAAAAQGTSALHAELSAVDPETAARLHPNDEYRIIRALEVWRISGRPLSAHHRDHGFGEIRFNALHLGIFPDRESLYERINRRVDIMLDAGFETEVRRLLDMGYGPELKPMRSLGYRHMTAYIAGETEKEKMRRVMGRDTRRYAKRQMTWFARVPGIRRIRPGQMDAHLPEIKNFLKNHRI